MSNFTSSILPQEVHNALSQAETSLAHAALETAYNSLYKIARKNCGGELPNSQDAKCLYLYAYHLDWLLTHQDEIDISEQELINILTVVERTSVACCPT